MPVMPATERAFCRSGPWRFPTRRAVLPWAQRATELDGEVLELGSGAGSAGREALARFPSIRLTASDIDPVMLDSARQGLVSFGDRVDVRQADATRLPFPDGQFDAVASFIMLHHTLRWEEALGEAARVLRPGGVLIGYDVVRSGPARVFHRLGRSPHRLATIEELSARLAELPLEAVSVDPALRRLVVRFHGRRTGGPATAHRSDSREGVKMTTATYKVTGMTCDHCVRAVTEEVSKLPGVSDVTVDLAAGTVTIASDTSLEQGAVRAAIDEAGYHVVG